MTEEQIHQKYMRAAIAEAHQAQLLGEVPIGAVIVHDGKIIACGHNMREKFQDVTYHAEMLAIMEACAAMGSWRLEECDLYVTLEPCIMCSGAIVNARIKNIYYGAKDPKAGWEQFHALCRAGKVNLCEAAFGPMFGGTLMDGTPRMSMDGGPLYHCSLLSTFAEYTVVPEMSCVKVADEMPFAQACMIGCGVATGYGAAVRAAQVTPGSSVAVFGIGGVGANALQGARIAGASKIIACDIKDDNLELAKKYGATHTVNTGAVADVPAAIKEITDGLGAEYVIDCTGNTKVGSMAFQSGRKGSTTVVIGAYPADGTLALPSGSFHRYGKILKGSFYGDVNPFNDFPRIAQLYLDGKYDLDSLIIEKIGLEDINRVFDIFHDPKGKNMGRYVIEFD